MSLTHNQYAVAAITATLCLAGLYTVVGAGLSSTDRGGFESATEDIRSWQRGCGNSVPQDVPTIGCDWDEDGIADRMEAPSVVQTGRNLTQTETDLMTAGK